MAPQTDTKDVTPQIEELRLRLESLEADVADNIKLINQHADVINKALNDAGSKNLANDFLEKSLAFVEQTYSHGQTYTTVVVGGGYAALFTLWNHLREVAPSAAIEFSGACMLLSVAVFVLSEVGNVVTRARSAFAVSKIAPPKSPDEAGTFLVQVGDVMKRNGPRPKIYFAQVLFTVIPGLAAAATLLYIFALRLFG